MTPMLDVDGLAVAYGRLVAVRSVSFAVAASQIVTIIGPNGAGKTSLLKAVMGFLPARGGIRFNGQSIGSLQIEERIECGMILMPESRDLFADMSVQNNLELGAYLHRRDSRGNAKTMARVLELFPRLAQRSSQLAGTLSGGERQMLALGRALMGRPKLLLLDEPSLGLAPLIVRDIFKIIADLRATGVAILLVEQNARAALETADYGYVLETGRITHAGKARSLISDPRVVASYLGGASDAPQKHPHTDMLSIECTRN
jgi:branched-chain amino acid transport system ATP-binding protein